MLHDFLLYASGGQGHIQSGICSVGTSCTGDPSKKTTRMDDQAVGITGMIAAKSLSSPKKYLILSIKTAPFDIIWLLCAHP